jgi:oligoendopeptidase F
MAWDLTSFFPRFGGAEMEEFKRGLADDVDSLLQRISALTPLDADNQSAWEEAFLRAEELQARLSHFGAYVSCLASADSRNEAYRAEESWLASLRAQRAKLRIELTRAVREIPDADFDSFAGRPAFEGARFYLRRLREESRRAMAEDREALAAELAVDGIQAWGRLYDAVSGKLEFPMEYPDGRRERVPISQRRSLTEHPDRRVREAAFKGGNLAWQEVEDVAAAALNAISGTRLTLNRRRGIGHFLEPALFQSAISRATLEAMMEAVHAHVDLPRRMLRFKARRLGVPALPWYDLTAPLVADAENRFSWDYACHAVEHSFERVYPKFADFVRMALERKWIDWEPRAGKRPGGFCTGSLWINEPRIFMTYRDTLGDLLTLAHEAGHAYHHHLMNGLRPYARSSPMTLAETASTFGELVLMHGLLDDPSLPAREKLQILDTEIGHAAVYLLDIPTRFEFEKSLYEERARGEIPLSRLKTLMVETQRRIFGDALAEGGEDPYFWASKLHFYITGLTFYNFPYTFGFLLSRGLYSLFQREGSRFLPCYEEFLRSTGSDTAENVARRAIGRNLESPEFWADAIRSLEEPFQQLEDLSSRLDPES